MTHQPHKLSLGLRADVCTVHRQSNAKQMLEISQKVCTRYEKHQNRKNQGKSKKALSIIKPVGATESGKSGKFLSKVIYIPSKMDTSYIALPSHFGLF